jgi:hypothetical protein
LNKIIATFFTILQNALNNNKILVLKAMFGALVVYCILWLLEKILGMIAIEPINAKMHLSILSRNKA